MKRDLVVKAILEARRSSSSNLTMMRVEPAAFCGWCRTPCSVEKARDERERAVRFFFTCADHGEIGMLAVPITTMLDPLHAPPTSLRWYIFDDGAFIFGTESDVSRIPGRWLKLCK
jgi:hypothetical protein